MSADNGIYILVTTDMHKWVNEYTTHNMMPDGIKAYRVAHAQAIDGDISISDCSRTICLDFNFEDETTMRKRIAKIDKMIEMLQNARNVLPQLLADRDKVAEEFRKQEEKEKKNE